ncbi:MAG: FprA family A-type flavoprotein [Candidatus Cryptobacteroides sp.]
MKQLTESIMYVGVNDNKKTIFEGLWPLPYGVSYNSYIVKGDSKIALIDTVEAGFEDEFFANIAEAAGERSVDYLVINHMEPDHSSLIAAVRAKWPDVTLVTSAKAVPMIEGYYGETGNIIIVKDGDTIDLGGINLTFKMTPMLHWPETMVTYCPESQTLFSGDAFGCFGALDGDIVDGFEKYRDEMIRYYSNIVGKYGSSVQAAFKKLAGTPISRICSTHGPIWETEIADVTALYDKMSRYETEKGVCIAYGSMYGNTAKAAESLAEELKALGIPYALHDLCTESPSFAYRDVFKYDTIAVGSPTYNNDIYPPVASFIHGLGARLVKNHKFFAFGSYTWACASIKMLNERAEAMGFEIIDPGKPFAQGFAKEKCDFSELASKLK